MIKYLLSFFLILFSSNVIAGDPIIVQKFGSGTLTRTRSGVIITSRFGNGTLVQSRKGSFLVSKFGNGSLVRKLR